MKSELVVALLIVLVLVIVGLVSITVTMNRGVGVNVKLNSSNNAKNAVLNNMTEGYDPSRGRKPDTGVYFLGDPKGPARLTNPGNLAEGYMSTADNTETGTASSKFGLIGNTESLGVSSIMPAYAWQIASDPTGQVFGGGVDN